MMNEPKHDPTPDDEFNASIDELIRRGEIDEVSPGQFSLTSKGRAAVRALLGESREARDFLAALKEPPHE